MEILLVNMRLIHQTTRRAIDDAWLWDSRIFTEQLLLSRSFHSLNVGDITPIELSLRCLTHILDLRFHKVVDCGSIRFRIFVRNVAIQSCSMQEAGRLVQQSQRVLLLRCVIASLHVPTCRPHFYILFIQILV